mmetsp:Transcript_38777/g.66202  ORF Transcript_38777/g.66202 Transcript_38777/m.66202 type:complete len:139 (+) Transcript_38777:266-682(+)
MAPLPFRKRTLSFQRRPFVNTEEDVGRARALGFFPWLAPSVAKTIFYLFSISQPASAAGSGGDIHHRCHLPEQKNETSARRRPEKSAAPVSSAGRWPDSFAFPSPQSSPPDWTSVLAVSILLAIILALQRDALLKGES